MVNAASLQEVNARLKAQLEEKERLLQSRERRIVTLEELIKQFNRKQFSASSEKLSKDQLDLGLFNEAESTDCDEEAETPSTESEPEDTIEVPAHKRRKKPRVSIPAHIPREEVVYELPLAENVNAIMVDGYGGYGKACQQYGIARLGCSATAPAFLYLLRPRSRRRMPGASSWTPKRCRKKAKPVKRIRDWPLSKSCTPWRGPSTISRPMNATEGDKPKPNRSSISSGLGSKKAYLTCRRKARLARRCITCIVSGIDLCGTWTMVPIRSITIQRRTPSGRLPSAVKTGSSPIAKQELRRAQTCIV